MILYQLRCANGHQFEAWFRDGATYDAQAAAGEIACPHCDDTRVEKAPMAPRLAKGRGAALDVREAAGEMRRLLGEIRSKIEQDCDYVGNRFPEEARRIHYGETEPRGIYGEATAEEARDLAEEGVEVARIPWLPPEN